MCNLDPEYLRRAPSYLRRSSNQKEPQDSRSHVGNCEVKVEYKDKMYRFAMNGQTGKLVGELPIDSGLFWKNALGFFAGSSIVVYLLIMLVRLFL